MLRKNNCGKIWLEAPRSLQRRVHFAAASPAEASGEELGLLASSGIYFVELPCPGSRQVMTMKDSEVASCCSLRKWQAQPRSACDSGCLCLGTGGQPGSDGSSHAQGRLERVNSRARTINLFELRCGLGVNRQCLALVGCAETPQHCGGLGSSRAVLQRNTSHGLRTCVRDITPRSILRLSEHPALD